MTTQLEIQPKKYGLALHTTTPELGLAISNFGEDTRFDVWNLERNVSSLMHQYLIDFIKPQTWADLTFIAVAAGPGGFTGTRIGVVTARTLGQQLNIPVFAISTLGAIAYSQSNKNDTIIAVQMPAQRSQVFAAIYLVKPQQLTTLLPDTVFTQEAWQEKLANWNTSYQLIEAKSSLAVTVTDVLQLAYLDFKLGLRPDWSEALPYYVQHPVDL